MWKLLVPKGDLPLAKLVTKFQQPSIGVITERAMDCECICLYHSLKEINICSSLVKKHGEPQVENDA